MDETARAGAPDAPDPERDTASSDRGEPARAEAVPPPDGGAAPPPDGGAAPGPPGDGDSWPALEPASAGAPRPELDPAIKAAGVWLHLFSRTVKTCRLYEATNPTVLKFREELTPELAAMLERHGAVTYQFSADDVSCGGQPLASARARDSSLAFAFYRDGVRGLTFRPGADERECNAVVNAVLGVTGQNLDGDD